MGCGVCGLDHVSQTCNLLGRFEHVDDTPSLPYARLSLPTGLVVRDLVNGSKTVVATKPFLRGIRFGPFNATSLSTLIPNISFPLKIFLKNGETVFLKTDEEHFSNWMCLVSIATSVEEVNMYCYQIEESIYFSVITDILPGSELKVWYSPHYAKIMNAEPLPCDNYLIEPDIFPIDVEMVGDHQYFNTKESIKTRKRRRILSNIAINYCKLPENIKDRLPAEVLGAKSVLEWKCSTCNEVEPNLAAYASHLIHHIKLKLKMKCDHCTISKRGKHERFCKLHHTKIGTKDSINLTEEEGNKTITQPSGQAVTSTSSILSDVTNSINTDKTVENMQGVEMSVVAPTKHATPTSSVINPTDNLLVNNCDKESDSCNYQFEVLNNKTNLNMQVSNFCGSSIWNNNSGVQIGNEINSNVSNNLVPLNNSNLSSKERQLDLNPPLLDLSDEIEFPSLKNFSDEIDTNRFIDKPFICRNEGCPDLFDNVTSLLNSVDNISSTTEHFPIFSLDKSEFLQEKFDNLLDVTEEDKNRLVENLLKETGDRLNMSTYDDELVARTEEENLGQEKKKGQSDKDVKKYSCEICKKCFSKPTYLIRHLRKHTGEFSCKFCMSIFARKETLLSHKCLSDKDEWNRKERCGICSAILYSKVELVLHIAKHYCTNSKWECKHCKFTSDNVDELDKHYCTNANELERQFFCNNCYKSFYTSKEFINHKQEVNIKSSKMRKSANSVRVCEICGLVLNRKLFWPHLRSHKVRFHCKQCGQDFTRKDSLDNHSLKHSPPKLSCTDCGKLLKYRNTLRSHSLSHSKNKKFICEHCGKAFQRPQSMVVHSKNCRLQLKCKVCQKSFLNEIALSKHSVGHIQIEDVTSVQPYLSNNESVKKKAAKRQKREDSSVMYICQYCNIKTQHRQSLQRHLSKQHIESKEEWDVPGGLNSMKIKLVSQNESDPDEPAEQIHETQNVDILDKERLLQLVDGLENIEMADSEDFVALNKDRLLDIVNGTANISVTESADIDTLNKERLLDLANRTLSIPVSNAQDLIALSKERLLDLVNGTSDVTTLASSHDLIGINKEQLLDLPVEETEGLGLNVDNIRVSLLWANGQPVIRPETLNTKLDEIVPIVQLSAPVANRCLNIKNEPEQEDHEPQNEEIIDKERLFHLVDGLQNVVMTDPQDFVALNKDRLLDIVNGTSNIPEAELEGLISENKELLDLANRTLNIPVSDAHDLVTLNKQRLLDLVNGTSSVTTLVSSQDLIELNKGLLDIPVEETQGLVGLNVDNIRVNLLWTNGQPMIAPETLDTKNDTIVPIVELSDPEEYVDLNVDNSCLNNDVGTYILEDGRIMNEEMGEGGDIFLYVVEPAADEQELLFV